MILHISTKRIIGSMRKRADVDNIQATRKRKREKKNEGTARLRSRCALGDGSTF